jgi:hypothetical protein
MANLPCLVALVFALLSVVLRRRASGVGLTWMHIGSICETTFLSV